MGQKPTFIASMVFVRFVPKADTRLHRGLAQKCPRLAHAA